MANKEIHIELLKAYIRGELNASDSLFVEQELAKSDQWQDVYEGLVFAEEQQIDIQESLSRLKEQINTTKPRGKVIPLRKYIGVAASLAGLAIILYATATLMNQEVNTQVAQEQKSEFNDEFDDVNLYDDVIVVNENEPLATNSTTPKLQPRAVVSSAKVAPLIREDLEVQPIDFDSYIGKFGYYEIQRLKISEIVRGANAELPERHFFAPIKTDASPENGLIEYQDFIARNRIARYPFNGKVVVEFTVSRKGKPTNFSIIQQDDERAGKALIEHLQKETWQPAIDENNIPVKQLWQAEAHFGNTVYLRLNSDF